MARHRGHWLGRGAICSLSSLSVLSHRGELSSLSTARVLVLRRIPARVLERSSLSPTGALKTTFPPRAGQAASTAALTCILFIKLLYLLKREAHAQKSNVIPKAALQTPAHALCLKPGQGVPPAVQAMSSIGGTQSDELISSNPGTGAPDFHPRCKPLVTGAFAGRTLEVQFGALVPPACSIRESVKRAPWSACKAAAAPSGLHDLRYPVRFIYAQRGASASRGA